MNTTEALATFASDLKSAADTFKPKAPTEPRRTTVKGKPNSNDADYRLDLALQNLLTIGSEFAPDDILALRRRARFGDARWLYSLYDEMMRLGPAAQVLKAREAIKSTRSVWHATPDEADEDENSTDPEDKAARLIRDVTEEAWDKWLPDLKNHLSTKFFYGIAACQVMWKPKAIENKWSRVTDIRPIPARRFRLDPITLRFKFLSDPYSWEGPYVDDLQKTGKLIFVEVGADTEPLDQRGLLFQCLIPWAIEQFTVRWRAKRLQNFGMPPVMVKYPKGDPQNYAVANALADQLANGTRAVIPEGMDASLLTAAGSGSRGGDPYESNIEWCGREYDKICLGHSQVSAVQVGAGSKASSKDAIGLFKDVTNSRAQEVDNDLEQQAFRPYTDREFGTTWAEMHTARTVSALIDRDDPVELSTVALNLFNAGAAGSIAVEDLVERTSLVVAEDGETTLAGNVKGEIPAPAEIDAQNKANPPAPPQQIGADGKPLPAVAKPAFGKPSPGAPGQKPGTPGKSATAAKPSAASGSMGYAAIGDFQPAARAVLKKRRKGARAAHAEFYTKRQRFGAASLVGGRPRITLTTFGHEHGAPEGTTMNVDVRSMASGLDFDHARSGTDPGVGAAIEKHPMTGAIYGGVKSRIQQAIGAGTLTGDSDMNFGIGCDHGKHRSVYVAERLKNDLLRDGHDVTTVHRDASDVSKSGPRGIVAEQFYSEDQPREDNGRWGGASSAGLAAEKARTPEAHTAAAAYHHEAANDIKTGGAARAHADAAAAHQNAARLNDPRWSRAAQKWTKAAHTASAAERSTAPLTRNEHNQRVLDRLREGKHSAAEDLVFPEQFSPAPHVGKPAKLHEMQARIAARVRARLKEQYALALNEAEAKLAKAE